MSTTCCGLSRGSRAGEDSGKRASHKCITGQVTLLADFHNAAHSCSRHGVAAAGLSRERPRYVIPRSKPPCCECIHSLSLWTFRKRTDNICWCVHGARVLVACLLTPAQTSSIYSAHYHTACTVGKQAVTSRTLVVQKIKQNCFLTVN